MGKSAKSCRLSLAPRQLTLESTKLDHLRWISAQAAHVQRGDEGVLHRQEERKQMSDSRQIQSEEEKRRRKEENRRRVDWEFQLEQDRQRREREAAAAQAQQQYWS